MITPEHVEHINVWWEILLGAVGVVGSIVGAVILWEQIRTRITKRVERAQQSNPQTILDSINSMKTEQMANDEEQNKKMDEILVKMTEFKGEIQEIGEQITTLQNEKMQWAYAYYGIKKHPIPMVTRNAMEIMYNQYKANGQRNHVPDDFIERIRSAPIEGIEGEKT